MRLFPVLGRLSRRRGWSVLLAVGLVAPAAAAPTTDGGPTGLSPKIIFDLSVADDAAFAQAVARAKALGATHVVITEDIPRSAWESAGNDDPYPAWYAHRPSILKIFAPPEIAPFVDRAYRERAAAFLEKRCELLRAQGLKAVWIANEPQVLPEAFFVAYPQLRGPRVDHPQRARLPRFAPCVDEPETLRLYRQAMQDLLDHCPEIDTFDFLTSDSGSGLCWAPALYAGANGPADCENRPMAERVAGFLKALQAAGQDAGHPVEVNLHQIDPRSWMTATFSDPIGIARQLPRGLAVNNREGPDARPYEVDDGTERWHGPFYPVVGIPVPTIDGRGGNAPRTIVHLGNAEALEFDFGLYRIMHAARPATEIARIAALRRYAVELAGEPSADELMAAWSALTDATHSLAALDFGPMLTMGAVLNRWVDRPLVPFPEELPPAVTAYYRPYLLQAKGAAEAADVADIQAMRMYEGWGARLLFHRVIELTTGHLLRAQASIGRIKSAAGADPARWDLLLARIDALQCLLRSADDMVAYQAQLDRLKASGTKAEVDPVLGTQSGWDRTDLETTARRELDNAVHLRRLLLSHSEPLLDLAPAGEPESIMRLSHQLPDELNAKIAIMNAHWEDYRRLVTEPNL